MKKAFLFLSSLALLALPFLALADVGSNTENGYSMMGGWPIGYGLGSGWMIFGGFFMILFWFIFIGAIVLLVRALTGGFNNSTSKSEALEILKQRYAKGEVNKKEFEQIKKDLN